MGDIIAFGGVVNGYIKAQKKLIKKEMTSLHYAVENGKEEMVKLLLSNNKIDVNMISKTMANIEWSPEAESKYESELDKTALHIAVENEKEEIVKMLLEHNDIDVNIPCKSTIVDFKWKINEDAGDQFSSDWAVNGHIKSDEKYSYKVKTALHLAVENGNIAIINLLLNNKNIDVNAKDDQGRKPIDLTDNEEI